MALTAEALRRSEGARGRALDGLVRDLLQAVDGQLRRAVRAWGRNCVSYELPDVLPVPGLSRREAQLTVYARAIRDLEGRGFETRVSIGGGRCVLHVAWTAADAGAPAAAAFLRSRLIPDAGVPAFVRGPGAPGGPAPGRGAPGAPAPGPGAPGAPGPGPRAKKKGAAP